VSVEVLQSKQAVSEARSHLEQRGISCLGMEVGRLGLWERLMRQPEPRLGDRVKSWDVLKTAEFVEAHFPRSARVLDLGAYCSEILCVLHKLGFERLTGIDLNRRVRSMPFAPRIRYEVGNFLKSPFPDGSFDVVTSISVIEHGYDPPRLLAEMSRLLAPGGCFVASFDYWPDKIDTAGTKFFGMDWCIFSGDDVKALVAEAGRHGLSPVGALSLGASERTVSAAGRDYTFGWVALRKRR
jgi:SAM-dependent methyltransferase